ncbi:hypothetical protein KBC99_00860 [Candidatus Saccharibacteria bacterium]|nr:hypothetical protein [Candidatus Saccharibacteria bacterium]
MAERLSNSPEKNHSKKTEALRASAERSKDKAELSRESNQDREPSVEQAREKLNKVLDREPVPQGKDKPTERSAEPTGEPHFTKRERDAAFKRTMTSVRHQLPPLQRSFSKFIHAKPVETTAELLEETFFRTSFMWGGLVSALLFGGGLYIYARIIGFQLSGSEFTLSLIIGGIIGFIIEKIFRIGAGKNQRS